MKRLETNKAGREALTISNQSRNRTTRNELRFCSQCGSDRYEKVFTGPEVTVVRCAFCGLMRLSPDLPDLLSEHLDHAGGNERYQKQRRQKEEVQLGDFLRMEPILKNFSPNRGKVLEVGCGTGAFLASLVERGWDGTGVESDLEFVNEAREKFGLEIIHSIFETADFEENSFDAVIMLHVIEHMPSPRIAVEKAMSILKPHGILVIETPRFDTIWFRLLRHRERSVIRDHLYYFTRKSITNMLEEANFVVRHIDSVGRTLTIDRLLYNIAKVLDSGSMNNLLVKLSDGLHLDRLTVHLNTRDLMRIYAEKLT